MFIYIYGCGGHIGHATRTIGINLARVVLDSPVCSTLFTLERQNSNQVLENSCAEAVASTPPS